MNKSKIAKTNGVAKNKTKSTQQRPCANCGKFLYITNYYLTKKEYKNFYCDKQCEAAGRFKPFPEVFDSLEQIYSQQWSSSRGYLVAKRRQTFKGIPKMYHQHRVVAEFTIRRKLTADDTVNHLNGLRDDNRPENLVVVSRHNHPSQAQVVIAALKQRVLDLEEILAKHAVIDKPPVILVEDLSYGVSNFLSK